MFSGPTEHANALPALTRKQERTVPVAVPHLIRFRSPRKDLTGRRFGKLVVISWSGDSRWLCKCDCGNESRALTANLKRGNTGSCGCVRNIKSSKRATIHGLYNTRAYKTWLSVKRRCFDTKCSSYQDYGAKGISMWDVWRSDVARFVADVGQPPTANHTLDRIENSQGYFPGNVRWATPHEQGANKTNNRWVIYQGGRYTISQLARKIAAECQIEPKAFQRAFERAVYDV